MDPITFRTEKFAPYLPDECQVNPNVLGYELAHWLSVELMEAGLVTSYPNSEDWGWFLDHTIDNREYMICCSGNKTDEGNHEWQIYIERPRIFFRRSQMKEDELEPLMTIIIQCLAKEGIKLIDQ
jgi:hypothetical protein